MGLTVEICVLQTLSSNLLCHGRLWPRSRRSTSFLTFDVIYHECLFQISLEHHSLLVSWTLHRYEKIPRGKTEPAICYQSVCFTAKAINLELARRTGAYSGAERFPPYTGTSMSVCGTSIANLMCRVFVSN